MNKKKAVSMLLITSMVMSMTGCSGTKKKVIAAADEYAKAILEADAGDLADLMEDEDEAEEYLEEFFDKYADDKELQEVYDFILENATYKIDKKAVGVSDKKATVRITYTIVDYMTACEELDDGAEAEDLLDELENTEDTTTIIQKLDLKLVNDEWKIADDNCEDTIEFYEFYQDISDMGFGKLKAYTAEEIEDILIDVAGASHSNFYTYDMTDLETLYYYDGSLSVDMQIYSDCDDALEDFEDLYYEMIDEFDAGNFDGEYSYGFDGESGYVVVDGTLYDGYWNEYSYGGIYLTENTIIIVSADSNSSSAKTDVDAVITALGYPTL